MKSHAYWEEKYEATKDLIQRLEGVLIRAPYAFGRWPRRKDLQRLRRSWEQEHRLNQANLRRHAKALRRLQYIEERIRATTPTFWSKL